MKFMAYQSVYQNQKKLRKLIIELRKEGISNQAIFEMLAPDYRDKNAIAAIFTIYVCKNWHCHHHGNYNCY